MAVNGLLKQRRLRQTDAAAILGIPQSKVSSLVNYRLDHFSVEKLPQRAGPRRRDRHPATSRSRRPDLGLRVELSGGHDP